MCDDGTNMLCGTSTGDTLLVNVNTCLLKEYGPQKEKYSLVRHRERAKECFKHAIAGGRGEIKREGELEKEKRDVDLDKNMEAEQGDIRIRNNRDRQIAFCKLRETGERKEREV